MSTKSDFNLLKDYRDNYYKGKEINIHLERALKRYGYYSDFKLGDFFRFDEMLKARPKQKDLLNKHVIQEVNRRLSDLQKIKEFEKSWFKGRVITKQMRELLQQYNQLDKFLKME